MARRSLKKGGRQKKTRICKKKGGLRKTKKHGGGLFNLLGTASRVGVTARNALYKNTLENRLVNKYNDYEWVQERRTKNMLPRKDKSDYTENDWTSEDKKTPSSTEEKKKGWFW
jgi:hypothetical protein